MSCEVNSDELFGCSPKDIRSRKKKKASSSFLDDLLAENSKEAPVSKKKRCSSPTTGRLSPFKVAVDWDYINEAKGEKQPNARRLSEELSVDDAWTEAFDDVPGAELPSVLRKPKFYRIEAMDDDGDALSACFAALEEDDLVEALSQGYATAYLESRREEASPALARRLWRMVALDSRPRVARAAAGTLVNLSRLSRRTPLAAPDTVTELARTYTESNREAADAEAAERWALVLRVLAACAPGDGGRPDALVDLALRTAPDVALAATATGRASARALVRSGLEAAAKAEITKLQLGSLRPPAVDVPWPALAARLVVLIRTLPTASAATEVRRLTARAVAKVLVGTVLRGTEYQRLQKEMATPDVETPWLAENYRNVLAALTVLEGDAGGGGSREAILGSHERFYAALVACFHLYAQLARDLAHDAHRPLLEAATALARRLRHEMDTTAARCHEFFGMFHGAIQRAAQSPPRKQAIIRRG